MITTPTTFITGAGASYGYGFPLGFDLVVDIINLLDNLISYEEESHYKGDRYSVLRNYFQKKNQPLDLKKFRLRLYGSGTPSIDRFLENNLEFEAIGKFFIALAIFRRENPRVFNIYDSELARRGNNWLAHIWYNMTEGTTSVEDFKKNQVSFVTFNYDRSLEYFFVKHIRNFYDKTFEEALEIAKSIDIVHVYGHLGEYDSLRTENEHYIQYELYEDLLERLEKQIDHIYNWSSEIRVITSKRDEKEFENAYKLLSKAENVYVLGFGFDKLNLKRLRLRDIAENVEVYSTGIGMYKGQEEYILEHFQDTMFHFVSHESILSFLREVY